MSTVSPLQRTEPSPTAVDGVPPTGRQLVVRSGGLRAVVTEVGAGLRAFTADGLAYVDGFPEDDWPHAGGHGQLLAPFPNRVDGGRYTFDGREHQLPVNEAATGNAIHGLTRWLTWEVSEHTESRVELRLRLHRQPGYPFDLLIHQAYAVDGEARELTMTHTVRNVGAERAPYAVGSHTYLTVGSPTIDHDVLRLPAASRFADHPRHIPQGDPVPVDGTPFDFRSPRRIGDLRMDVGFTDLLFDPDGRTRVRLATADGRRAVTMWADRAHRYLQVFTGDPLPEGMRRTGIAVEPCTAATDAFNNRRGLRELEPGEEFVARWGITVEH
ncbi:aldose 1-epimerase family protein [Allostreptomyces psammosilenae]|uniref:Aldose 1-epimerase n=1 Tax=Allostreptomyces psammosilenae TaxID=1892865 RepID=A0A852ZRF5_9ACTN|nr:aldose 1-epimerase family protein [Allostreptomyces psammosilenae]NYI04973.1 aldose 1-epimerase [Allostreptomyces psammosilenae]